MTCPSLAGVWNPAAGAHRRRSFSRGASRETPEARVKSARDAGSRSSLARQATATGTLRAG